jgi:hypothetical protein
LAKNKDRIVTISRVSGSVFIEREGGILAAQEGMRLSVDDIVKTEGDGSVQLVLGNVGGIGSVRGGNTNDLPQNTIDLRQRTSLGIGNRLSGYEVTLLEGEVRTQIVEPLAADEDFTLIAGNLAVGIRAMTAGVSGEGEAAATTGPITTATEFVTSLNDDLLSVTVEQGTVSVMDLEDNEIYELSGGDEVNIPIMLDDNRYRVVLTWNDEPSDIEANLVARDEYDVLYHVGYQSKNVYKGSEAEPIASLDQDITSGQGPEMITFTMEPGLFYEFAVSWYSGSGTWASSGATVHLYLGYVLVHTFYAPPSEEGGGRWTVFTLRDSRLNEEGSLDGLGETGTSMWGYYFPLGPSGEYSYYSNYNYYDDYSDDYEGN